MVAKGLFTRTLNHPAVCSDLVHACSLRFSRKAGRLVHTVLEGNDCLLQVTREETCEYCLLIIARQSAPAAVVSLMAMVVRLLHQHAPSGLRCHWCVLPPPFCLCFCLSLSLSFFLSGFSLTCALHKRFIQYGIYTHTHTHTHTQIEDQ